MMLTQKEGLTHKQAQEYSRAVINSDYFSRFFMDWSDGSDLGGTDIASNFFQTTIDQVWKEEEDEWTETKLSTMRKGIEALLDLIENHEGGRLEYFTLRLVPSKEVLEPHGMRDYEEAKDYFGAKPIVISIYQKFSHMKDLFVACLSHEGAIQNIEEMRDFEKKYKTEIIDFYKKLAQEVRKIVPGLPEVKYQFFEE